VLIISLLIFYSLVKFRKNKRWLIAIAFLVGVSFHIHLSLMLFLPIILWVIFKNFKKIKKTTLAGATLVYLAATSPLIVFDFVHNFSNLLAPFNYFFKGKGEHTAVTIGSIVSHSRVFLSSLGRFWFLKFTTDLQNEHGLGIHGSITPGKSLFIILSILAIGYFLTKIKKVKNYGLLAASAFIFPLVFIFYPGYAAEYYLLGFFVLFPFILAISLEKLSNNFLVTLLGVFLILNIITIVNSDQGRYGLTVRKKLIKKIGKVIDHQPFSLETYGKDPRRYHPYGGWRYLFKIYGQNTPAKSFADEFFGWIYPDEQTKRQPKYRVIITDSTPYLSLEKPLKRFKEGIYYGYIFNIK